MYEAHHRSLQHLQWRNPGRWVLKYPKHLLSLDALLAEYPDAVFIWTHRDPAAVVPSVLSLTSYMRQINTPDYDPVRFGREWAIIEELALHRGLATRDRDDNDARHIDVDYQSLMRDPVATVVTVCERLGIASDDTSRQAVQQWLDDNPQDKHGVHRYTAEEFGLDPERLRARLRLLLAAVPVISGERILVTGVTGTIGSALALHLAAENDVWGVARFADPAVRAKETFTAVATPSPTGTTPMHDELAAAGVTFAPSTWPAATSAICPTTSRTCCT